MGICELCARREGLEFIGSSPTNEGRAYVCPNCQARYKVTEKTSQFPELDKDNKEYQEEMNGKEYASATSIHMRGQTIIPRFLD